MLHLGFATNQLATILAPALLAMVPLAAAEMPKGEYLDGKEITVDVILAHGATHDYRDHEKEVADATIGWQRKQEGK